MLLLDRTRLGCAVVMQELGRWRPDVYAHLMANVTHSVLLKLNLITLCEPQRARTSQRGRRGVGVEYSCTEVEVSSRPNVYTHTLDGLVFTHAHSVGCAGS